MQIPRLSREGYKPLIAVTLLAVLLLNTGGVIAVLPAVLLAAVLFYLFRDYVREVSPSPLAVVSPVDGTVTAVDVVHDPFLDRQALRIRIGVRFLDPYVVHSPAEGKIMQQWYGDKKCEVFPHRAANCRTVWVQTDEQDDVVLSMMVHKLSLRLKCYLESGQRVGQGQRCGFIGFGGWVDVLLPLGSRILVKESERVLAGSGVLGSLVHHEAD